MAEIEEAILTGEQATLTGKSRELIVTGEAEEERPMLPFGQLVVGRKAAIGGVTGCLLLLAVGLLSRRQQDVAPEAAARPIFLAAKHNATKIGNGTGHAEACRNAEPGEACYGAVLWHKWIGLVEQPNSYVNLTREDDRHNIQSWLYQHGRDGCSRPCKEKIPYPTPKPQKAWPKLYCFSVARTGPEMDQMFMQRQSGTGIFGCNGFDVYSDHVIDVDGYKTKLIPSTAAGVSVDGWAANSQVFMKTWMHILYSNFWFHYDFITKVDPDAVLFADRLRNHVRVHAGQDVFFLNCAVHHPAMYGAVEVFSKAAMGAYKSAHTQCEKSPPFWSWGEDRYLQECLKKLGVTPIADYTNNVRDARCWGSDCGNKAAVAFHPFKTVNSWYRCYMASA